MKLLISSLILLVAFSLNAGAQGLNLDNYMNEKVKRRDRPRPCFQGITLFIENTSSDTLFFLLKPNYGGSINNVDRLQPYQAQFEVRRGNLRPNKTAQIDRASESFDLTIFKLDANGQEVIVKRIIMNSRQNHFRVKI